MGKRARAVSILGLAGLGLAIGGGMAQAIDGAESGAASMPAARYRDGIDLAAIDPRVNACDNFYRHACGGFIAAAHPDANRPELNMGESRFNENLERALDALFRTPGDDPELRRLETFYRSCNASVAGANAADVAAVQTWLSRIDRVNSGADVQRMMRDLSQIGVDMTIQDATLDSVLTEAQKCKSGSDCSWQLVFFGTAGSWYFTAYPTGDHLFAANVKWNCGQYVDQQAFDLISKSLVSSDPTIDQQYSAYLATNLPVMWMPNPVYQVSVVSSDLNIGTQDPAADFYPERWSWKY